MAMKETYKGVEIVYSEENSRFEFELRGRERFASSMKLAKEAIDKPVAGPAGKKFNPVRALLRRYDRGVHPGTITSIAESSYRPQQVWFVRDENKSRSMESLSDMCEESEFNLKLLAELEALAKEADSLRRKKEAKSNSMKPIKITIPE
jgi:hypothetical protein